MQRVFRSLQRCLAGSLLFAAFSAASQQIDPEHPPEQRDVPDQPVAGEFHYIIIDVRADRVVARGKVRTESDIHTGLLLPAERRYREGIVHSRTLMEGWSEFVTPQAGQSFEFPRTLFGPPTAPDADGDGLSETAEFILGTNPSQRDSDGDGLLDGAELLQGSDPLDLTPAVIGPVAQASINGLALDVDSRNNYVAVAAGDRGVAVFNVGTGLSPTLIGQVDTPGDARRVALTSRFAVAADGPSGLAVIGLGGLNALTEPARIPLVSQSAETATALAATGPYVAAGTSQGSLFLVDPASGNVLFQESVGQPVQDLCFAEDLLLVVTGQPGAFSPRTLHLFRVLGNRWERAGSLNLGAFGPEGLTASSRISAGNGLAYITAFVGFDVVDVSDPQVPRVLAAARDQNPNSFKQIMPSGSGLGVAAVGINPGNASGHDIWLYDLGVPTNNTAFISLITLPGRARAVSLYNGLAYVAASEAGLQVVSYQPFDTAGRPPEISLSASFPIEGLSARAEEGKLVRVTAAVRDDVQVRQVHFYVDGERIAIDGNFPFETGFTTPSLADGRTRFLLQAIAFDTGGNTNSTPPIVVDLVPDATPPFVGLRLPVPDSFNFEALFAVALGFNEPVRAQTIGSSQLRLRRAGSDAMLGTADDLTVPADRLDFEPTANLLTFTTAAALPTDAYEVTVNPPITDLASNSIAAPVSWRFTVINPNDAGGVDSDNDGLPDGVERLLGLNPADPSDGQRDLDGDGLGSAAELRFRLNPRQADSDFNGIPDGQEDLDQDGLPTLAEIARGTDALRPDTDNDGWTDEAEATAGSDPLAATSRPVLYWSAGPAVEIIAPRAVFGSGITLGSTLARPSVEIVAPRSVFGPGITLGSTLARPSVEIVAPRSVFGPGITLGATLARPPVEVIAPRAVFGTGMSLGITVARPPVELLAPGPQFNLSQSGSPFLARPPITIQFQQ